jgi:hypothetical protein
MNPVHSMPWISSRFAATVLLLNCAYFMCSPAVAVTRDDFYENNDFGTLGLILNVHTYTQALAFKDVDVLQQDTKSCTIKSTDKRFFLVANHFFAGDQHAGPTFLGVQIISTYKDLRPSSEVYLYRNEGWLDNSSDIVLPPLAWSSTNQTLNIFLDYHSGQYGNIVHETAVLKRFQTEFAPWHARVETSGPASWGYKHDFALSERSLPTNTLVENYLFKFNVGKSPTTDKPLVFYTRVEDLSSLIIRTFSPESPDFDNKIQCSP